MFRFSGGEKLLITILILLIVINPIYAFVYYVIFSFYKLKDYRISDYLLLLLTIISIINLIQVIVVTFSKYLNLITNTIDETYLDFFLITISPTMLRGMIPILIVIPLFNYLMVRRYYNMEETMHDRILDSKFKIKEDERSIYDKEVIEANRKLEYREGYFRLGVNKNLEKVYYNESSQNAMIFATTGTGKTNLVMNIIKDSLLHKNQLIYVNGKGNLEDTKQVIEMCEQNNKEYIFINIGEENDIKYNPFKGANATTIRDMLLSLSDWTEEHYKTNASAYYQVVLNLINLEKFDIYKFLAILEEDETLKEQQKRQDINKWLKKANLNILDNKDVIKSSISRIMQLFGGDGEKLFSIDGVDILEAIKQDKAIIINLNPNNYSETSKVLFRLITLDIRKSFDYLDGNKNLITAVFDEFGTYANDEFINVLNQSRSSGYKIYPTAQSPADIKYTLGEDFLDRVIDNCNSFLFGRVNSPQSASYMADIIATIEKMQITRVTNEMVEGDKGTAKKVHQYIYHPSDIKYLGKGELIYCCKDTKKIEYVYSKYYID